jgi:hypothetical protein
MFQLNSLGRPKIKAAAFFGEAPALRVFIHL